MLSVGVEYGISPSFQRYLSNGINFNITMAIEMGGDGSRQYIFRLDPFSQKTGLE